MAKGRLFVVAHGEYFQGTQFPKFATESKGGSKRHKSSGYSSFNTESGDGQARADGKNKWSKASGSSTINDDALARLMVTEMTAQEK
ncbi:hypothetical protein Tco_0905760 [Tanacetum coccineum]